MWTKSWKRVHGNPWGQYDDRPLLPITHVRGNCAKEFSVARDGLVTLRRASNALDDYRFTEAARFRIGEWPAKALTQPSGPPIVRRTRRLGLPFCALLRASFLYLREGLVGVVVYQNLPEWAHSPIVASIAEESLESLAQNKERELPGATLRTAGRCRKDEGEVDWEG